MRNLRNHRLLLLVLALYGVLACLYSVATPIFEASDELWHYPMVKYLADHRLALPVQNPANPGEWRQEGGQPPLYYMLGAALTFWIDTSDIDVVRHINPHADIGVVVPDGNMNMIAHVPPREAFPWHGTVLAVHVVRLLSVLLGGITVLMAYLLAVELFPGVLSIALGAAALTAFNPMFLFISGSVNNDNLSNALASTLLLLIVRLVKRTDAPPVRAMLLIGVVAGAGMLAKFNIGFLLPLVALALALISWRLRDLRPLLIGGLITGGLTIVIAGWWYVRNVQLYGDPTGLNVFLRIVGQRPIPANAAQLWSERHTFLMSFWGFFGGVNVPMPDAVYTVFNALGLISVVGVVLWLIDTLRSKITIPGMRAIWIGRLFTLIWIGVLFVSLLSWTSTTWASQGRLMFGALAPISLWMAVGFWQIGRGLGVIRQRPLIYATGWFVLVAALVPLLIVRVYSNPYFALNFQNLHDDQRYTMIGGTTFCEPKDSNACVLLIYPSPFHKIVTVEHYLIFWEYFQVENKTYPFSKDWTVFIHLKNSAGLIVGQRDRFPRQGQWATTITYNPPLDKSIGWTDWFAVPIPDNAYAPQTLSVYMGFYDAQSGQRMNALNQVLDQASIPNIITDNSVLVGTVTILPRPSALNVPNPASINFADQAELVGYDVSALSMLPGQQVTLTLYWRAKQKITTDYHVFVHVLDPQTTTIYGQDDSMPAAWIRPTTTWQPGEIIKDAHTFTIHPDAAPGTWQIEIGMYQLSAEGSIRRLRIITPDGGEASDYAYLSRVLITPLVYF